MRIVHDSDCDTFLGEEAPCSCKVETKTRKLERAKRLRRTSNGGQLKEMERIGHGCYSTPSRGRPCD